MSDRVTRRGLLGLKDAMKECFLLLGQVWSSIMTPAAPASAKLCTVRLTFMGLP